MPDIWFTSDTHFGHLGILLHQPARLNAFEYIEEMDAQLIDAINRYVKSNDLLYHLGDFCWQASRVGHYRARLNVRQLCVCRGNHDASSLRNHVSAFEDMFFLRLKSTRYGRRCKLHLCHYPLLSWRWLHKGGIHLYGHSHGIYEQKLDEVFPNRRAMDVTVDNIQRLYGEWRPINLEEIIQRLAPDKPDQPLDGPFGIMTDYSRSLRQQ